MSPGRLLYKFWHEPIGKLHTSWRYGGPLVQWRMERGRRAMEATAATLPVLPEFPGQPVVTLHLMTGRRFWYQTVFCVSSFAHHARGNVATEIYDDGTIDADCAAALRRVLGNRLRIHTAAELRARLDAHLPASRFPVLRDRWTHYPNIRKLIDVHLGAQGWKLVIDSDLLFFRRPTYLLDWAANPQRPLHAIDCTESYGYPRETMNALAGATLPPLVNVGLCGLNSTTLDWAELERWCAELIRQHGTSYYLEQALVAMLVAREPASIAPAADYITFPSRAEIATPTAVMHHYVDTAKIGFFNEGWRHHVAALARTP